MDFNEAQYEAYCEWAENELVWGKGMFNWCRAYSIEEWKRQPILTDNKIDVSNHPLCKFGG